MKQTQILHSQEALIMGSITQKTETVTICNQLYKKTRKELYLNNFIPVAISISQIDLLVFKLTADKNMNWA